MVSSCTVKESPCLNSGALDINITPSQIVALLFIVVGLSQKSIMKTCNGIIAHVCACCVLQSEMFQEDIYPATASACPSLSANEWISGQNREPILVSLKVSTRSRMTRLLLGHNTMVAGLQRKCKNL